MGRTDSGAHAPSAAAEAFAALSQDLLSDLDEAATLRRVCARALEIVPGADLAAVTVRRRRGRLATLAHTDRLAAWADDLQYELREGPCVDSALEGTSFVVPSLSDDPRWPAWSQAVSREGIASLVSVDLPAPAWHPRSEPLGALNLYGLRPRAVDDDALARARIFAVHAATAFATARRTASLEEAVEARHRIGVAQGLLMARFEIDAERAFELMRRVAGAEGRKLRDVAAHVVATGDLPGTLATSAQED
ncbi:GAF and ANTAR domain-containing protein [Nocardioides sp.]|uniref:GAF and ANTAR domain-containing protein n=1 Tax=Nocardioides sp. TaxID=35761 RepID=UPI0035135677